MYGNKRVEPYGTLKVRCGDTVKMCDIRDGAAPDFQQYIVFNRKRYAVVNVGGLYSPNFVFVDTKKTVIDENNA